MNKHLYHNFVRNLTFGTWFKSYRQWRSFVSSHILNSSCVSKSWTGHHKRKNNFETSFISLYNSNLFRSITHVNNTIRDIERHINILCTNLCNSHHTNITRYVSQWSPLYLVVWHRTSTLDSVIKESVIKSWIQNLSLYGPNLMSNRWTIGRLKPEITRVDTSLLVWMENLHPTL